MIIFKMPNYQNSKIYKIRCNTTGLVYIGSTTQSLKQRLDQHIKIAVLLK
jgi:predicted GIY-YIG superfamily endonuclease